MGRGQPPCLRASCRQQGHLGGFAVHRDDHPWSERAAGLPRRSVRRDLPHAQGLDGPRVHGGRTAPRADHPRGRSLPGARVDAAFAAPPHRHVGPRRRGKAPAGPDGVAPLVLRRLRCADPRGHHARRRHRKGAPSRHRGIRREHRAQDLPELRSRTAREAAGPCSTVADSVRASDGLVPSRAEGGTMARKHSTSIAKPVSSDVDPGHRWDRPLQAPGHMQVDFEERVDFRRLHGYRLGRVRQALSRSGLGALLVFDQYNIRYISGTVIGEWARDKLTRWSLLTGNGEPWVWDFGSAARHHKLYAPWIPERQSLAGMVGMRGAVSPKAGLFKQAAQEIKRILQAEGVAKMPLGIDLVEPPFLFALQEAGLEVRDGQQTMLEARMIKSQDELTLLNMAAAMVDGVYQDIYEALKPGVRENEVVALATKRLYEMGSDCVEAINSISGERCSPHPHNFTDRIIRPGDQAFFDIIMSFTGYRTCYYRTFSVGRATASQHDAYKKAREWMDDAIALIKPGVSTAKIARAFPKSQDIGFDSEMAAFGLNFCHGIGLGLHERPIISRLNSFDDPMELEAGMMFAVETYCPATDGVSAARIEEEVIVTPGGAQIITLFPAQELPIANRY